MRGFAAVLVFALGIAAAAGCHTNAPEDVGVAIVALTEVPSDVACVRITVTGRRTVQKAFDVVPGQSSVVSLSGLPTGDDVFSGDAFQVACAVVGADTVANWSGDSVTANVSTTAPAQVSLTFRRNGRATVSVDFSDQPDTGPGLGNGSACASASACLSGFCVEGVCCDSACPGPCASCALPGSRGACTPNPAGAVCGTGSCVGNVFTPPGLCNGAGTCLPGPIRLCTPFRCDTTASCATTCATDADCTPPFFCAGGRCGLQPIGAPCFVASQCNSGFCADGVCCSSACAAPCLSCALPGTVGVCAPVPAGSSSNGTCVDQGAASCGTDGLCDGIGGCSFYESGSLCEAGFCVGGFQVSPRQCDGVGNCLPPTTMSCAPFTCGSGGACLSGCLADAECAAGFVCRAGLCVPLRPLGAPCAANRECLSGFCVAGVCSPTP